MGIIIFLGDSITDAGRKSSPNQLGYGYVNILAESIKDPERKVRAYLHGEHSYGPFSNHWIVTSHDKYIWLSDSGEEQYFDLESDPHELTNLISSPGKQERIKYLRNCLIKELTGRSEGFTDGERLIAGRPYGPVTK